MSPLEYVRLMGAIAAVAWALTFVGVGLWMLVWTRRRLAERAPARADSTRITLTPEEHR